MPARKNRIRCQTMEDVELSNCPGSVGHGSRLAARSASHTEERGEGMTVSSHFALGSALAALAAAGSWGYCLFDLATTGQREVRTFSKPVWVVLLVFTNVLGALMWFTVGRPQRP
jgi:hypothetical protein